MNFQNEVEREVDQVSGDLLDFAADLVRTPSDNPPGDQTAVAEVLRARLTALGINDVELDSTDPLRPNLIARVHSGSQGRSLLLNGHLDTKPPGDLDKWHGDPFAPVRRQGELYGLGSADMKGALAAMVYAARTVQRIGAESGTLLLAFTADEEAGTNNGARWLIENRRISADAAIIGEPSGVLREWEAIHLVSRGVALLKIAVSGTQMHSSISDVLPSINATVKMARLIDRMDREFGKQVRYRPHPLSGRGPTVNVGVMASAGVWYGVYPGSAEFACDVRLLPGMTREDFEADCLTFLRKAMSEDPELHATARLEAWIPPTEISPSDRIAKSARAAATCVLGQAPAFGIFPGGTDASHLQGLGGIPTLPAFGPGLIALAHGPNEHVSEKSIVQAAKIYALTALQYASTDDSEFD